MYYLLCITLKGALYTSECAERIQTRISFLFYFIKFRVVARLPLFLSRIFIQKMVGSVYSLLNGCFYIFFFIDHLRDLF